MKKFILFVIFICYYLHLPAQHSRSISLAFSNNNTALPFSKFTKLVTGTFHPGIEAGGSLNWKTKINHDWFQNLKLGYMYHHLYQHGISIYTQTGYRFKAGKSFSAETALGVGYLYSIPATQVYKLNEQGTYNDISGKGRHQAMATFDVGVGYLLNPGGQRPVKAFVSYQQRIQAPFVKNFMSLLPYNTLLIGSAILF
jgi:hypothetical protein